MAIEIGQLRQTGALQKNTPIVVPPGLKHVDNYSEFLITRGRLKQIKGRRYLESGQVMLNNQWEWITRFQVAIENEIDKKSMRWVIDNRFFTINSYELIDQKHFFYRFVLNEDE